ncbi:hypothetical protein HK102_011786, partial [Quaeritorhiza haematococci]
DSQERFARSPRPQLNRRKDDGYAKNPVPGTGDVFTTPGDNYGVYPTPPPSDPPL